jgi:hypothetical protein
MIKKYESNLIALSLEEAEHWGRQSVKRLRRDAADSREIMKFVVPQDDDL